MVKNTKVIRVGKYANYVGKIELKVKDFEKEIKPKVGDGRRFLKLITAAGENKEILFDKFYPFILDLLLRDEPELPQEDKQELEMFIDLNLLTFLNEAMISFGMTTRTELEQQKKDTLQAISKNVSPQAQ